MMLGKKVSRMKKVATGRKVNEYRLLEGGGGATTPSGTFPVYVGESQRRFVVPTGYASHPLFKIMLEKAYDEYGFQQRNGLVIPCSVDAFQQLIAAVGCRNRRFQFGQSVLEDFVS